MRRRLFNALAVMSLVVCMAMIALWARSYWRCDVISRASATMNPPGLRTRTAMSSKGVIALNWANHQSSMPVRQSWTRWKRYNSDAVDIRVGWLRKEGSWEVHLPHWVYILLASVLPSWWLLRWRARREKAWLCQTCGYDLRATPERCPECGKVSETGVANRSGRLGTEAGRSRRSPN
jgi:hypothetical protein